jgi:hypothetical protein
MFVNRFKSYADSTYKAADVKSGEYNTVMPRTINGIMKTEDSKVICAYIPTVKPVKNKVEKFSKM